MLPWMKPGSKQPDDTATVASSATAAWPAEVAADPSSIVAAPSAQLRADALTRWLAGDPPRPEVEQLLHALQDRDRGAARVLRERLAAASSHEQAQLALAALTARAQELVAKPTLTSQDAVEIDALLQPYAPAQWPEALTAARQAITERLHAQTELQALVRAAQAALADWRAAVRAAGSAPLAQAQAEHVALAERQQQLQAQVDQIAAQAEWPAMPPRLRAQWQAAAAEAFAAWQLQQADLARAVAALADSAAELPQHRGWAAEVRAHRAPAPAPVAEAAPDASGPPAARPDNGNHVAEAKLTIDFLERALAEGHLKAAQRHADKLRALLSVAERSFPAALTGRVQAAVAQTQQLAEWQRWRTDQLREELCVKAEALRDQPLAPRAQADALRQLRDEWKALDQTGAANGVLWQRFDAACTTAHAPVEAHVAKEREQMAQAEAARRALIDELRAWHAAQAGTDPATTDWRAVAHALDGFADRWRHGGHLPEKRFTKLQADWR
ncbi:MAG: DUF349 domain-containing protein, partial [Betaproteobacteria bacterium]|nr:DUF349 domain-containing protein [Betaproteobacteria bacterium]